MFKKYITKFFDKKNYINIKSQQKIEESIIIFKKNYEKKIFDIHKAIKEKPTLNFLHSGNLGDLIYSFAIIQELSKTHKCNFYIQTNKKIPIEYHKHPAGGFYIDERMLNLFLPLVKKQSFINKVEKYTDQEIDIDLDIFRTLPVNICFNSPRWYFHITGVQVDLSLPYLERYHKKIKMKNNQELREEELDDNEGSNFKKKILK